MTKRPKPSKTHKKPDPDKVAGRLIRRLQDQLLTLSDMDGVISPQDVERAAKAISQLVKALQDAAGYLSDAPDEHRYGYRPKPETRQQFLIKLKNLVDLGILDELDPDRE